MRIQITWQCITWHHQRVSHSALAGSPKPAIPKDCSGQNVSYYSYYYSGDRGSIDLRNATNLCHDNQTIATTTYVLPWSRASLTKNLTEPLHPGPSTTAGYNYTAHYYGRRLSEWLFGQP